MAWGLMITGYAAGGTAAMPMTTGQLRFDGAGLVLGAILCANLLAGFAALVLGAMRRRKTPAENRIHRDVPVARSGRPRDLATVA